MVQHLAGFQQSVDQATVAPINALADAVLTLLSATSYLVPNDRNYVHWGMAGGISLTQAQVVTPSLGTERQELVMVPRKRGTNELLTLANPELWVPSKPIPLTGSEQLQLSTSEDGAGATQQTGFIALGPQTLPPMPDGDIRRVRCTGTTTLAARAWTLVTLTPDVTLEPGTYHLVAAYAESANAVMCRFAFQGGGYRPGVPALAGASEGAAFDFNSALWKLPIVGYDMGTFTHLTLPQAEFFAIAADTAETVVLDVIRTGPAAGAAA